MARLRDDGRHQSMSLPSALKQLADYRKHNSRASQDIVRLGSQLLEKKTLLKLGDDSTATFVHSLVLLVS